MTDREPGDPGHDWDGTVSDALADLAAGHGAVEDARARQGHTRSRAVSVLLAVLPILAAIAAWNVWAFTRPPVIPSDEEIAHALRETAGALAEEVLARSDRDGRLPTPAELAGELDEELTYAPSGDAFLITNTDGVLHVRYDGRSPVAEWVATGGFTRVEEVR